MPLTIDELDRRVRQNLANPALLAPYFQSDEMSDREIARLGSEAWCKGPCWDLALAIHDWLGADVQPFGVSMEGDWEYPHHVLVKAGDYAIDGRGVKPWKRAVQERRSRGEEVGPLTWDAVFEEVGDEADEQVVAALLAAASRSDAFRVMNVELGVLEIE